MPGTLSVKKLLNRVEKNDEHFVNLQKLYTARIVFTGNNSCVVSFKTNDAHGRCNVGNEYFQ